MRTATELFKLVATDTEDNDHLGISPMHGLIGERWRYVRHHGVWDLNELYDLGSDPHEQRNPILEPAQKDRVAEMNARP